jgi:cobalt-zinc-cadmium efflux system membrane fusion protein
VLNSGPARFRAPERELLFEAGEHFVMRLKKHGAVPWLLLVVAGGQTACQNLRKPEPTQAAATSDTPTLLTVSKEQLTHLQIVPVKTATWSTTIRTTGTVDWDADHTTQAITQVNGPISRILVDLGSKVSAGDPLLYVASPDVANAISTYRKARNREVLAKRVVDRMNGLLARGAVAAKDVESSAADYNDAMTDVQNSLQALKIFAVTGQDIDQAEKQGVAIAPELAVRSPISGVIVQKLVSPGQLIQAGTTVCFMISDVSTVWVQGHIFDRDLPLVKVGNPVTETNPAFPRSFQGSVQYVGAFVDPATRTTPVRIVTQNPGGLLKKDLFVEANIQTGVRKDIVVVPVSAVLHDAQNQPIVYVALAPDRFGQRLVNVGAQQDDQVEITSGLNLGESVVAQGSLFVQFALTAK